MVSKFLRKHLRIANNTQEEMICAANKSQYVIYMQNVRKSGNKLYISHAGASCMTYHTVVIIKTCFYPFK